MSDTIMFIVILSRVLLYSQNIIRQCITQVMEQCTKHLHKVTNIDDFFRRICTVFHSNDPIARGLTLRWAANKYLL